VLATPGGLLLARTCGLRPVVLVGVGCMVVALVLVITTAARVPTPAHPGAVLGLFRRPVIRRSALAVAAGTMAAGVFVTFLPIAGPPAATAVAPLALLVHTVTATAARWGAGRVSDRVAGRGHAGRRDRGLLALALLGAGCGTALPACSGRPWLVVTGLGLFGVGYGAVQNLSLTRMLDDVPSGDLARVSAVWNLAFDAGMGAGAVGFGVLLPIVGYSRGLLGITAGLLLALVAQAGVRPARDRPVRGLTVADRRSGAGGPPGPRPPGR